MKVGVCLKQVPASDTRIKIAGPDAGVDTSDVKWELNPYDEFALEAALQLADNKVADEVVIITVGDAGAEAKIREGLARGAGRAVRIELSGAVDSLSIARAMAAVVKSEGLDLVLLGKQAIDTDNAQVPAMLAEVLGWGQVTDVDQLELSGSAVKAWRASGGGGRDVVATQLPAVISTDKGLNEPRYASLRGIMQAKRKKIAVVQADGGGALVTYGSWGEPPARPPGRVLSGDVPSVVQQLVTALREEAKVI